MLRAVNGFLGERLIEGRFMTLCFATWNRPAPPPARRQRRPGAAAAIACRPVRKNSDLSGFPLGNFRGGTYDERSYILDPGDVLVLYSDGIADAQASSGEFFGQPPRVRTRCRQTSSSADEIADSILEAADRFRAASIRR